MISANPWVSATFMLLCFISLAMFIVAIYRAACRHRAYKQREDIRVRLVEAYVNDELTSAILVELTELLYRVDAERHAMQLFWFDAPCIIYDTRLWTFMPPSMFEGYDEDAHDMMVDEELDAFDHQFDIVPGPKEKSDSDVDNSERTNLTAKERYMAADPEVYRDELKETKND